MSLVSAAPLFTARNSRSGYQIEQSLRFRGNSTYFTKTFGSSGNRRKFTLSVWVKKATVIAVSPNNTGLNFFGSNSGSVGDSMNVGMNADTTAIQFYQYNNGYTGGIFSAARYRDPSAWMHMVFVWDSAQATQSNRMAVYVNNRIERPDGSDGSPDTGPSQNKDAAWNYSSYTHTIGGTYQTNDMYIAEAYHIDGQALDPSSFGEYDSNGVWRPIKPAFTESSRYSASGYEAIFDGNTSNGVIVYNSYVTVASGLNITATSTIGFHDNGGSQLKSMRINGTTELTVTGGSGWQDFSFTGTINTIELKYNGSTLYTGIRVDGTTLVDNYGDYGQNGFYLKFDPSATNGIGHDHSGNGNNWSPTGFTTSGGGTDVMSDTPTKNWATLNAIDPIAVTFSEGNLKAAGTNSWKTARSTIAMTTGKWYWEVTPTHSSSYVFVGVVNKNASIQDYVGKDANGWSFSTYDGTIQNNNSGTSYGSATASGVVLGFAFDADTGKMWVRNASGFFNSGDPAAGTNPAMTAGAGEYYVGLSAYETSASNTANFGQRDFAYSPPTDFKALNTSNLPAPTVKDGSDYFNTVLYTGTSSTQSITGIGFQPDFTWVKRRDSTNSHALFDAVRGAGERISSNEDSQEIDNTAYFTSFDSDGFSVALNGGETNLSSATYVAWNWLAGGSGSTNTDGNLSNTVTVSANPSAGFSIVKYTGDGVSNATVGHGLNVVPSLVMSKVLSGSTGPWYVKHKDLDSGKNIYLNLTSAQTSLTGSGGIGDLSSSTTITLANGATNNQNVNTNGRNYITYCFSEVPGFSKFGKYIGNGNADGPFVATSFAPAWLMIKNASAATGWYMVDNTRNTYNEADEVLFADLSNAESVNDANGTDILSNGFKIRDTGATFNTSGSTYIYMAFAENPFGGSGVSPATAR